ncbi:MAG TPA: enoyl-CoA hydratase/isomerase family protein [Pseudomonadales bacterium]|nr:enoyl-CoA hydratase/isomerase family protein [Pseudomonadales bacterium]
MITTHEQQLSNGFAIGWLTLALPRTLNALTLDMARTALLQLEQWVERRDIACVVLRGEGRAFCAGGDVRQMRQGILDGDDYCERFFEQEYRLDYALHRYPKPVLVWGHGIVMGGGLGLFMGGSHRVVTTSTRMAMPEINIGLYPDVGASYFLNQLPAGLGLFLGITGCEWNAVDALALGMAQFFTTDAASEQLPALLASVTWSNDTAHNREQLTVALRTLPAASGNPCLTAHSDSIRAACSNLQTAVSALPTLDITEAWFQAALHNLNHGCPVTARLVEQQLQRGRKLPLADIFRMEWCMSVQCSRHADFPEGVRAHLVDKDKQPCWQFTSTTAVPDAYIQAHFQLPTATSNPLNDLA